MQIVLLNSKIMEREMVMKTNLLYFNDTQTTESKSKIISSGSDPAGFYLILESTIFHPQGGGQPSDTGTITLADISAPILSVKKHDSVIKHYTNKDYRTLVNKTAIMIIDPNKRRVHSNLHTAGHLISNIIEKITPHWRCVKGHHFPNECYVEFNSKDSNALTVSDAQLNEEIQKHINWDLPVETNEIEGSRIEEVCGKLPYKVPATESIRVVRINNFPWSPCGGTHSKSTGDINGLTIIKSKIKHNSVKYYYEIN